MNSVSLPPLEPSNRRSPQLEDTLEERPACVDAIVELLQIAGKGFGTLVHDGSAGELLGVKGSAWVIKTWMVMPGWVVKFGLGTGWDRLGGGCVGGCVGSLPIGFPQQFPFEVLQPWSWHCALARFHCRRNSWMQRIRGIEP